MGPSSAILGIDLGSTSARAFLWSAEAGYKAIVENKDRNNLSSRYEKGEFSTYCHPFDGKDPVYVVDDPDPDRQYISLKYAFYILANASDELMQQYPLVQPMLERKGDPAFQSLLSCGLRQLFFVIRKRVEEICTRKKLRVDSIALSVPAQWKLEFEDAYRGIVADVFSHPPDKICFHTEIEALAHYLFNDCLDELDFGDDNEYAVLFLDFGGHNMSGCTVGITHGEDTASFYRIGNPFGAGGGSEHWEYNIGEFCSRLSRRLKRLPARKQMLVNIFNREKPRLGPGYDRSITLSCNDGRCRVTLEADTIAKCFDDALRQPLAVARDHIEALSLRTGTRKVVVSGRTCRHEALQKRLRKMCSDAGLDEPIFTDKLEINDEHGKIAKGVAYAAGNRLSIEDFFRRGAAFGLQLQQHTTDSSNPENLWDDTAFFLLDLNRERTHEFWATGRDKVKIVCDPFRHAESDNDVLHYYRTYDFIEMGELKRGWWRISLSLVRESMSLLLERWRKPPQKARYHLVDSRSFPCYFDGGANCILVGAPGVTPAELGLGLRAGEDQTGHCSDGEVEVDDGPGPTVNEHRPPKPRLQPIRLSGQGQGMVTNRRGVKPSGSLSGAPRVDFH